MKARVLAYVLPALILTTINLAEVQQAKKVARICYLGAADASTSAVLAKPFRERLREIGYVEGQNLTIEFRHSEGKDEHLPELAAELVRLNCDVIVTVGSGAAQAAKKVTKTTPSSWHGARTLSGAASSPASRDLLEISRD